MDMLASDSVITVRHQIKRFKDHRVIQFYDPRRKVGKQFARVLNLPARWAWDVYLFFDAEKTWANEPPMPVEWIHQLSKGPARRFYSGKRLQKQLEFLAGQLLQTIHSGPHALNHQESSPQPLP